MTLFKKAVIFQRFVWLFEVYEGLFGVYIRLLRGNVGLF